MGREDGEGGAEKNRGGQPCHPERRAPASSLVGEKQSQAALRQRQSTRSAENLILNQDAFKKAEALSQQLS